MPNRTLAVLLFALAAVGFVFGAGTEEATQTDVVTLSYITWAGGGQREADEAAVAKFNEDHELITVEAEFVPYSDFDPKLNTLIAAGTPPDLSFLQEYKVHDWGAKGTIADVTSYFRSEGPDLAPEKFVPGALFQSNGKIWGATPGIEVILVFYNKDLFDEYGIEHPPKDAFAPWTWDEFVETATQLTRDTSGKTPTDPGFNANAVQTWGTLAPTAWLFHLPFLYSNDAYYGAESGTEYALDSAAAVEVIQSIADLSLVHKVAPTPAMQQALPAASQMLINGQLAMEITGQWAVSVYGEEEYYDVGIAPLPMFRRPANIAWGAGIVMYDEIETKDAAWEFMKTYINPEAGISLSQAGSWMPNMIDWFTRPNLFDRWTDNERHNEDFLRVVPDIATDIAEVPENVTLRNFGPITDITQPALDEVWFGDRPARDVLRDLRSQVSELYIGAWE